MNYDMLCINLWNDVIVAMMAVRCTNNSTLYPFQGFGFLIVFEIYDPFVKILGIYPNVSRSDFITDVRLFDQL